MFRIIIRGLILTLFAVPMAVGQGPEAGPPAPTEASPSPQPTLRQISPHLDFGAHKPLAFMSETVTLVNEGKQAVTLVKAIGECSCTDATILGKDKKIEPGEQVDILVAVEFPREMGLYTKNVLIYEEGNERPYAIPFNFEVGYPIRVNDGPRYAVVVDRIGRVRLSSMEQRPFNVWAVNGAVPIIEDFVPGEHLARDNYVVGYDWSTIPARDLPRWLVVETDHPGAEMMMIPARIVGHRMIRDKAQWHSMDEYVSLGTIAPNAPVLVSVLFTGKALIPGKGILATSSNNQLAVTVVNARKPDRGGGMAIDFEFTPGRNARGFLASEISIEYDGVQTAFDLFARIDPKLAESNR